MSADEFVRYSIAATTIDGPPIEKGAEVGLKVLAVVEGRSPDRQTGAVLRLRIVDWGGPWPEKHNDPDPPAIPDHVLRAATLAVRRELDSYTTTLPEPMPEALARAALEAAARLIQTHDEAVNLLVGVREADVVKLTRAGDALSEASLAFPYAPKVVDARQRWRSLRELYGPKPEPAA